MPPSAGPTTPAVFHMTWFIAAAGASSSGGTRFGVIDARVGMASAMKAEFSAAAP